ncbi:hypothetical protein EBZ38_15015 [bacterium]|nr:hypothetical protein [bacterium]
MKILLRYNNNSKGSNDKWRLLIDDKEYICTHIHLKCPSETCMQPIEENGELINKYHIRAYNFKDVFFHYQNDKNLLVTIE